MLGRMLRGSFARATFLALAWLLVPEPSSGQAVNYLGRALAEWQSDLEEPVPEVRRRAARALGHFGPEAVPALSQALRDDDVSVRIAAARALARMGPAAKEAVPVLMHALKDGNDTVRSEAAQALRMIEGR
jgi:HEAT repeat protein